MTGTAPTPASLGILADDPAYNATLAARVDDTDTLARVWIKPDGAPTPFEKELERHIERATLLGKVQIGPYVDDMPAAYMLADVVVTLGGPSQGFSRALIEAQAMGRLGSHPHIVTVFDLGEEANQQPYMVTELMRRCVPPLVGTQQGT